MQFHETDPNVIYWNDPRIQIRNIALVGFKTPKFVFISLRFGKKKNIFFSTFIISSKYNSIELSKNGKEGFNVKSS